MSSLKAHELGSTIIKHILSCTNTSPDDVIIGQSLTAAQGQNPARQSVLASGLSESVTATTINMLCGSGLKSCALGYQAIKCGDSNVVVCGGQESMSQAPHCINLRNGHKMNDATMVDCNYIHAFIFRLNFNKEIISFTIKSHDQRWINR